MNNNQDMYGHEYIVLTEEDAQQIRSTIESIGDLGIKHYTFADSHLNQCLHDQIEFIFTGSKGTLLTCADVANQHDDPNVHIYDEEDLIELCMLCNNRKENNAILERINNHHILYINYDYRVELHVIELLIRSLIKVVDGIVNSKDISQD